MPATAAGSRFCDKCRTTVPVRSVQTVVPGTRAVRVALCRCDYGACRACHAQLPWDARRCPSCNCST